MNKNRSGIVSATGIKITDGSGEMRIDLTAAMASSLGHRHQAVLDAMLSACQNNLGIGFETSSAEDLISQGEPFASYTAATLTPSASAANEVAIRIARRFGYDPSGSESRYRIITVLGGDHGDTLACRSASGRIDDQAAQLPLVPGFRHVAPGDLRALEKAVDSQCVAVLIAPVDWMRGGEPFDVDYLRQVRQVCDDRGLLLILDETQLPVGISGHWFFHQAAGIDADVVTAAAGWTGGLPGGMVLVARSAAQAALSRTGSSTSGRVGEATDNDLNVSDDADDSGHGGGQGTSSSLSRCGTISLGETNYPVLRSIVLATANTIQQIGGPSGANDSAALWARHWQELVDGFEFISGCVTLGTWAVARFDLSAHDVRLAAENAGLRLLQSSDTTLIACLPIAAEVDAEVDGDEEDSDRQVRIFAKLRLAFETIERQTIES